MTIENISLSIQSKVDRIAAIDSVVRSVAIAMRFAEDDVQDIELAIHEAVANAVRHGSGGDARRLIDVRILVEGERLIAEIRDRGAGFDPRAVPSPLEGENLLRPSGRGLLTMRALMDEVTHSAHPEGGTVARLQKQRRSI